MLKIINKNITEYFLKKTLKKLNVERKELQYKLLDMSIQLENNTEDDDNQTELKIKRHLPKD